MHEQQASAQRLFQANAAREHIRAELENEQLAHRRTREELVDERIKYGTAREELSWERHWQQEYG